MNDELIRRAAFLQTQAACALIEAISKMIECAGDPEARQRLSIETRGLIDYYGIGHNAALTFLGEAMS